MNGSHGGIGPLGRAAHDPLEVDVVTNEKVVFTALFESVFLIEANGSLIFAEYAHIDFGSVFSTEVLECPGHEFVTVALAEVVFPNVDLPEFHGSRSGVLDGNVNGADFGEGDEATVFLDNPVDEFGVGEFFGDTGVRVDGGEEGIEILRRVEMAEGLDEGIATEGGESFEVGFGWGAKGWHGVARTTFSQVSRVPAV